MVAGFVVAALACGSVNVYDSQQGNLVAQLAGHARCITGIAAHPTKPLVSQRQPKCQHAHTKLHQAPPFTPPFAVCDLWRGWCGEHLGAAGRRRGGGGGGAGELGPHLHRDRPHTHRCTLPAGLTAPPGGDCLRHLPPQGVFDRLSCWRGGRLVCRGQLHCLGQTANSCTGTDTRQYTATECSRLLLRWLHRSWQASFLRFPSSLWQWGFTSAGTS